MLMPMHTIFGKNISPPLTSASDVLKAWVNTSLVSSGTVSARIVLNGSDVAATLEFWSSDEGGENLVSMLTTQGITAGTTVATIPATTRFLIITITAGSVTSFSIQNNVASVIPVPEAPPFSITPLENTQAITYSTDNTALTTTGAAVTGDLSSYVSTTGLTESLVASIGDLITGTFPFSIASGGLSFQTNGAVVGDATYSAYITLSANGVTSDPIRVDITVSSTPIVTSVGGADTSLSSTTLRPKNVTRGTFSGITFLPNPDQTSYIRFGAAGYSTTIQSSTITGAGVTVSADSTLDMAGTSGDLQSNGIVLEARGRIAGGEAANTATTFTNVKNITGASGARLQNRVSVSNTIGRISTTPEAQIAVDGVVRIASFDAPT